METNVQTPEPNIEVISLAEQFGRQLYERRTWRGISQAELARRVGMHQSTIAKLEQGKGNPTASLMQKLLHAVGSDTHLKVVPCPYYKKNYPLELTK